MRLEILIASFKSDLKTFFRSKATLFWTLAFPVMLILIFGAIFSGMGEIEFELYVQNLDENDDYKITEGFLQGLETTGYIKIKNVPKDADVKFYMDEHDIKRILVIPEDFSETIIASQDPNSTASVNLSFYFDQSEQTTNQQIRDIISYFVVNTNMNMSGGREIIGIDNIETISGEFNYIDFFIPGMIGFTIMQTCIYGSLERNTKYRKDGILRKLLTTPITRSEWIISKMLFQLFLSFLSALIIIIVGILVFGLHVHLTVLMFVIIISTSFLFTGLGMMIGRFVKDEESAGMAGGAVTFPMMFLAGTFFELEMMPDFLQTVARGLPLYYVNEGLRDSMIKLEMADATFHATIVLIFAVIFFVIGLFLTKWKED
jgi:ABC-2 type transport system permease protein